jgi:hypothetical protein
LHSLLRELMRIASALKKKTDLIKVDSIVAAR